MEQGDALDIVGQSEPREVSRSAPSTPQQVQSGSPLFRSPLTVQQRRRVAEVWMLHELWKAVKCQENLGGGSKRVESFALARKKVELLAVTKYKLSLQVAKDVTFSRKFEMGLLHRQIKRQEEADYQLASGILGPVRQWWARLCGMMTTEEVIIMTAGYDRLKIPDELLQDIVRQGRGRCEPD